MDAKAILARMRTVRDSLQAKKSDLLKERDRILVQVESITESIDEIELGIRECETALEDTKEKKMKDE